MEKSNALANKPTMVEEIALSKIKEDQDKGMVLPVGFNPTNSLKKARFILNDLKDKNGKPVLESCTRESIIQCLLDSASKGLDYSENQVYFIPRGNQLTNLESVYGRIIRAKRASKNYKPIVQYVHEGDVFEFGADVNTGATKIFKHETNVENLDKPIIAAYTFVTDNDGFTDVFIMTKKEWLKSWQKSSNGCAVAKDFERDMIYRTIIKKSTKSLVNSNQNVMTYSPDNDDDAPLAGDPNELVDEQPQEEPKVFVEPEGVPEDVVPPQTPVAPTSHDNSSPENNGDSVFNNEDF